MPGSSLPVAVVAGTAMLIVSYLCGAVPPEIQIAILRRDPGRSDKTD
jgi:hypothetical protein